MMPSSENHIPTGCFRIRMCTLPYYVRELIQGHSDWKWFDLLDDSDLGQERQEHCLDYEAQKLLIRATGLARYARLFRLRWIKLQFKISSSSDRGSHGVVRVYLLPDDVQRGTVNRSDLEMRKDRKSLLEHLDYSKEAWDGNFDNPPTKKPIPWEILDDLDSEETSLLQLFNNIQSPNPTPEQILEPHARDRVYDISEGRVPGLLTTLYPYQRRSAAVMLQKEVQPGLVLDPRLRRVRDQEGSDWYLDLVEGTVLKGPRHYDAISGGILAEEMGSGKTIICLALILATKDLPTRAPEVYGDGEVPVRKTVGSLVDMAACAATRFAVPWKLYFETYKVEFGEEFSQCIKALERNPRHYFLPTTEPSRCRRYPNDTPETSKKMILSSGSLVVVPNNLAAQWREEILKHTTGLSVLYLTKKESIPALEDLLDYDIILFSQSRFEKLAKQAEGIEESPFSRIHFKRCIVDEGHKLGNSRISNKSTLLTGLDAFHFSSRWVVTGTPSHGLFGVDNTESSGSLERRNGAITQCAETNSVNNTSADMEKKDLQRIGAIASLYLKVRPWANTASDTTDTMADWATYLMLPKHNTRSRGSWDCLRSTLNSLIVRHQLHNVDKLLPTVDEKVIMLDGSYQDQLSLNIFSIMIIFNAVQSQRTGVDYLFHSRQRKSLLQIVSNLKQACFFGGSFFSSDEISKSVQTAQEFLQERNVEISSEDRELLRQAIKVGQMATGNSLRNLSNQFHEISVAVQGFPSFAIPSWSLDVNTSDSLCTSASMLLALQSLVAKSAAKPEQLNSLVNGGLVQEGIKERERILDVQSTNGSAASNGGTSQTFAGNTKLGDDSPKKVRCRGISGDKAKLEASDEVSLGPLEASMITSTVSSKLSYLTSSIVKYQRDEKIIVFYENENVAWYLASTLDVLQVQYLIYAKGLTTERRAQYVNTFHHNPVFRVLLMDLSQAAFGLDMREASRIYFTSPVLNPQVEAQAIGRVRRISQQKAVSVETLVLRNSIEEVILERKNHMTQAEHRQAKSILDIRPIYDWIKNASIIPLDANVGTAESQMAPLHTPQPVFRRGYGRTVHPNEGLVLDGSTASDTALSQLPGGVVPNGLKRQREGEQGEPDAVGEGHNDAARPSRRVRFEADADE